ncbi:MAG: hypothetical protein MI975_21760 [Cytophagales bacterium]|nr:hypothetical protein [Cytophagales bacterium]
MKAKTRTQLASEYGVSRKTLYNWLKNHNIVLGKGQLTPSDQKKIIDKLGPPDKYNG